MVEPTSNMPAPAPKKSGLSCLAIGLLVAGGGVVVIAILAALLLPAVTRAISQAKAVSCANNLRQMWTLQSFYASQFGGPQKLMPEETGSEFWLKLTRTAPPVIDSSEMEVLVCPVKEPPSGAKCDYLGPAKPVSELKAQDPIGADRPGYHRGGGNLLRKAGDVTEVQDPEFPSLAGQLKP